MFEESSRLSAVSSSSSNDRISIATSLSTDLSDSDRPVSLVSTASSDSLPNGRCYPYETSNTGANMTQSLTDYWPDQRTNPDPNAFKTLPKDSPHIEAVALSKVSQMHNNNNNAVHRQSARGSVPLSPFAAKVTHKLSYVERVVLEIVETERIYVRDLRSIVDDYLGAIIDSRDLPIKPEQVIYLFRNIEDIYQLNSKLLQDLYSCNNDPVKVAYCFVEKSLHFEIYTQYCTNYPNSVAALTECMRNKVLAKFFRDRQELLKHTLPLGSYLLRPVQRILQYHLLLQEIAKHFDMGKEGYDVVEEAIGTMTGIAWYINEMKRKHEHAVRLQEIQSLLLNWKGEDLTMFGELVLEGTFRIQRARNERTLFLFYKALIVTKKRGDHFVYKTHIPCSSLMLIESNRESLSFTITRYKNRKQQYIIQVRTVEEKRLWTHHIKELMLEHFQAKIPQKAKEAILEMDALYPSRYKYSPERQKKMMQTEDPTLHGRQGRRQSDPPKQILKHLVTLKSREPGEMDLPKGFKRQRSQTSGKAEKRQNVEVPSQDEAAADIESIVLQEETPPGGQHTEEKPSDFHLTEPTPITQSAGKDNSGAEMYDPVEQTEAENVEDLKILSSDDEEEEAAATLEPESILPPSVLDHASIIAERFVNGPSKSGSVSLDDGKYVGGFTPRLTSRSSSTRSLDGFVKPQHHGSSSDVETGVVFSPCFSPVNRTVSPSLVSPNETERPAFKRKDSTLSKEDRLLLDKIKGYYDHAESHDVAFSIKRRESLSYIPSGVVRNSVFKFDTLPKAQITVEAAVRKRIDSSSNTNHIGGGSRPASWAHPDVPLSNHSDDIQPPVPSPKDVRRASSTEITDQLPITDEEFKPPSEMFKVWEEMEKAHTGALPESSGPASDVEGGKTNLTLGPKQNGDCYSRNNETKFDLHESLQIIEDCDLSTITEESPAPSPESTSPSQAPPAKLLSITSDYDQLYKMDRSKKLHPKVLQLAQSMDADLTDKMKNKVYQLARKYSQRIKGSKPVIQRHLKELEEDLMKNSLTSVQEEKQTGVKGKLKPALLSLPTYDHVIIQEHTTPTPASACSSAERQPPRRFSFSPSCTSPGVASPTRPGCRSPLSPAVTEKFHWPDVRELRSKYAAKPGRVKSPPVSRSQSVPESIANSSNLQPLVHKDPIGRSSSTYNNRMSNVTDQTPKEGAQHNNIEREPHTKLSRAASLNPNLAGGPSGALQTNRHQCQEANGAYYVSAEAPLENDRKFLIMERLCNKELLDNPGKELPDMEHDDCYVQIRSPTSREKISLKAVVERCKVYQESEEYCQREAIQEEEAASQTPTTVASDPKETSLQSGQSQNSRVKSLREKFQTSGSNS